MNLDHIKAFLAVYRAGSFIDVANELGVAPSSISRSVSSLESAMQTRLFQRTTRSLTPTLEGEAYFNRMAPLVEEMDLAHESLLDSTARPAGRLRVTASVSYGQVVIAPQLARFRAEYPDIDLELIMSDGRVDLINERIDLAVRHGTLDDSSLIAKRLANVEYYLVSSETYLNSRGIPQTPEELNAHELVTFTYDAFRHYWHFDNGKAQRRIAVKPALTATNAVTIRQCVRDGLGIALLADWTVEQDLNSGRLTRVLPGWKARGTSDDSAIWLVYPSNRFVPAKTKAFAEFVFRKTP